jgi:hypothetical protein
MTVRGKKGLFFGALAGLLCLFFGKSPAEPAEDDLKHACFSTSTQRLGVRFTEKIRDVFRFRWLRKT